MGAWVTADEFRQLVDRKLVARVGVANKKAPPDAIGTYSTSAVR